jgi:hypothetical protein
LQNNATGLKTLEVTTMVSVALVVAMPLHKPIKLLVPLPWGLLQAVQAFCQPAHELLFPFDWKTLRLLHVDLLF